MIIHEKKRYFHPNNAQEVDPETTDEYSVVLDFECTFEPEDYLEAFEAKCKEYRKKMSVPGFRRGTVPMHMVKARIGKEVLREMLTEALNQELGSIYFGSRFLALTNPIVYQQPDFKILEGNHVYKAWMNIADIQELNMPVGEIIEVRAPVDPLESTVDRDLLLQACSQGETIEADPYDPPVDGCEYFVEISFNAIDNFKQVPAPGEKHDDPGEAENPPPESDFTSEDFLAALAPFEIPILAPTLANYQGELPVMDEEKRKSVLQSYLSNAFYEKKHPYFSPIHPAAVRRMMALPPHEWHPVKLGELFPEGFERNLFSETRLLSRKIYDYIDQNFDLMAIRYGVKKVVPAPIDEKLVNRRIKLSRSVSVDEYREIVKVLHMSSIELEMQEYLHDAVYGLLKRYTPVRFNYWMVAESLRQLMKINPEVYPRPKNEADFQQKFEEQMQSAHQQTVHKLFFAMQQKEWQIPDRVARVPVLLGLMKSTLKGKNDLREVDRLLRSQGYPSFDEPTEQEIDEALIFTEGFRRIRALFTPEEWAYMNVATDMLWQQDQGNLRGMHYLLCVDNYIVRRCIEINAIQLKYVYPEDREYEMIMRREDQYLNYV